MGLVLPTLRDLLCLPDPVAPGHCLDIILGVPVRIEEDDSVGRGEVESDAAGLRREEEADGPVCLALEGADLLRPLFRSTCAV